MKKVKLRLFFRPNVIMNIDEKICITITILCRVSIHMTINYFHTK